MFGLTGHDWALVLIPSVVIPALILLGRSVFTSRTEANIEALKKLDTGYSATTTALAEMRSNHSVLESRVKRTEHDIEDLYEFKQEVDRGHIGARRNN